MKASLQSARTSITIVAVSALLAGVLQVMVAPAAYAAPIFTDDFSSGNFSNWTSSTRLTIDNGSGSPASPSARAQVTSQSAFAYRNLGATFTQVCMSENVNVTTTAAVDLFRLRTGANGGIIKAFRAADGTLRLRSDFAGTSRNSGTALGNGWHNVELCGSVGSSSTWDLYRDGVRIVNAWQADTGTTPVGRIQIGDTAAKTFTANFDHVVLDQVVGDEGQPGDTDPPTTPGRPAGTSPNPGEIQISWTASTDASPITYRIYRDGGGTQIGTSPTTSFTDQNLTPGTTHTYRVDAIDTNNNASQMSQASLPITVSSPPSGGNQPVPGHTRLVPDVPRTNVPIISNGYINDIAYIGNRVFIAGTFTSIRNNTATNTTSYNQARLASYNIDTGLVDANFRPTFDDLVNEVEPSPDGTKLFVVGRFNTVNGVTKRKIVSLNPTTGATVAGFTANANSEGTAVEASNTTVYVGGRFSTVNGVTREGLVAVNASTGQVVNSFVNNLSGGIAPNGELRVQQLVLSHDGNTLLVVHTGRQINGQDRYAIGLIDTRTNLLLPWRTRLWDDNLQFVGGIQRIRSGDISPDDQYFVVTSGSGGDRPPISDTAVAFPLAGGDHVEPLWISRCFDSIYSVAITEDAVYIGGHFQWNPSPSAPWDPNVTDSPWPGLTEVGYGTGQGLSGYGLGDDVVRRDHVGALDPATGHALEWNPGSNSFQGNEAMLATPRGLFSGGDTMVQGGRNVGRVAFYDFNTIPAPGQDETTITNPIEGRVEKADEEFVVDGTATATSGVQRVQLEVRDRDSGQYLQDDLTTFGGSNTINVNLASPNATSTSWSLPLTLPGNRRFELLARTFGVNGTNDATKARKTFETFGLADQTPTTSITGPNGGVIPTTTFTVTGSAQDDMGINAISVYVRDADNLRYLQDDGTTDTNYNAFRVTPDVIGATNTTWSYEITVPYEGNWKVAATAIDTAGQADLREAVATWLVSDSAIAPSVAVTAPAVMNPPTATAPLTLAPGSPLTFSGSATDDEQLRDVEITLRNSATRENLASDGTWGTNVNAGNYRISPQHIGATSYNWSYTTPFNLRPGQYTFTVRATDELGLTTSSANQGRLTINVQVPGDAPPNGTITPTGTQPVLQVLHLDLAGAATDDFGVEAVRLSIQDQDTTRYLQPNGTLAAGFTLLNATLANPNATSTTWTLSVNLPSQGDYAVTAFAYDTSDQVDLSTTGATSRYPAYPGDQPPMVREDLFSPDNGTVFTEGKILVAGRVEDDQQIAAAQVAIVNNLGQYMSSSGTFTSTTPSWRTAFLNSPGSPGSQFAYTSPTIPAGVYTVYARGVDQHGFITTVPSQRTNITVQVPPNNPPVANFTYSCNQNVCSFDGRSSTDETAATLTYSWNFGNGSGTGPVPTRTYTSANTYNVTLTVRDEWGVTSAPFTQPVTIVEPVGNQPPVPVINTPSCAGRICNFSGVGSADPNTGDTFTYLWNFGDGTPTSTSSSPAHTFAADGTYTITLTTTDGWGKAASTTRQITLTEPANNVAPTAVINTPNCTGLVCNFSGVGSSDPNGDAITYLWNFGDNTTSTSSTPTKTYAAAGTYTVTLTVTDWWGRTGTTTRQVTV